LKFFYFERGIVMGAWSSPACFPVLIFPLPSEPNPFNKILNQQYPFITTTLSLSLFSQSERAQSHHSPHLHYPLVIPSQNHENGPTHRLIVWLGLIIIVGALVILTATGTIPSNFPYPIGLACKASATEGDTLIYIHKTFPALHEHAKREVINTTIIAIAICCYFSAIVVAIL
jgi:hypothetical protein